MKEQQLKGEGKPCEGKGGCQVPRIPGLLTSSPGEEEKERLRREGKAASEGTTRASNKQTRKS